MRQRLGAAAAELLQQRGALSAPGALEAGDFGGPKAGGPRKDPRRDSGVKTKLGGSQPSP